LINLWPAYSTFVLPTDDDAQSENDDDEPGNVLEAILGQVGQRDDTAWDEDGVGVSVGVNVDAIVGIGVHDQGVGLGVGLVVGSPHLTSLDSQQGLGARLRSGSLMT